MPISDTGGKLYDTFAEPVVAGLLGYAFGPMIIGCDRSSVLPNLLNLSVPIGVGLAAGVGTGIGGVAKNWVLPYIPQNSSWAETEGMLVTPVLSGLATAIILHPSSYSGDKSIYLKTFATGALSSVGANYVTRTIISPYMNHSSTALKSATQSSAPHRMGFNFRR